MFRDQAHLLQGIRFHGLTIPDCQMKLPPAQGGKELLPESMLWLLLTGEIPSESQVRTLSRQLAEQGQLPSHIEKLIDSLVAIYENSQLLMCSC